MAVYDRWAEFYDIVHQGLPGEAEFYVGQAVRIGGRTLELGCGTGRIAIPIAMSGGDVTGLDNSGPMLERCRAKLRAVGKTAGALRLVQADMTDFDLGEQFDLIVMPYRTFMHLMTPAAQRRCLETARRHLQRDGVFMLNMWVPKPLQIAAQSGPQGGGLRLAGRYPIPSSADTLVHYCSSTYDEAEQLLIEEHLIHEVDAAGRVRRSVTLPLVRTWVTRREMDNLVRLCGFAVEALFGDFDCRPFGASSTEMLWVLRDGGNLHG
ncbi:MAG TPA: class I SAM-dependent methyltransferase [Candidatus Hydrogenedentes bacterium]|nr:class I SAM-dependent methyltransferase [Candidatus Hydrogenedentota bacterium]HIJ73821.1 class I SAM-dependent methyltransferase [Candidatus Hydrogenedentota bacterium]